MGILNFFFGNKEAVKKYEPFITDEDDNPLALVIRTPIRKVGDYDIGAADTQHNEYLHHGEGHTLPKMDIEWEYVGFWPFGFWCKIEKRSYILSQNGNTDVNVIRKRVNSQRGVTVEAVNANTANHVERFDYERKRAKRNSRD